MISNFIVHCLNLTDSGFFVCFVYVHGQQLRSCRDGQLLNHTVPGQASQDNYQYYMHILSPLTDNMLFFFPLKNVPDARVDLWTSSHEAHMIPIELPRPVNNTSSVYIQNFKTAGSFCC